MSASESRKRRELVGVRLTTDELALALRLATERGITVADVLRSALDDGYQQAIDALRDRRRFNAWFKSTGSDFSLQVYERHARYLEAMRP